MRFVCSHPATAASAIPIHAVLGNHDYGASEGPALQRGRIPELVTNWHVTGGLVDVVELAPDVSLILFDSELVVAGAPLTPLTTALRDSTRPRRVLVGHRPIRDGRESDYAGRVDRAIRDSGVTVQVLLSGHRHNLQAWADAERPGLHVIAGSGAGVKPVRRSDQDFAREQQGFVRIDWGRTLPGAEATLHVSMFDARRWPWM